MEVKKILFILLPLIVVVSGTLFYIGYRKRNLSGPVTLTATSIYGSASVFINDSLVGTTPYRGQDLESGKISISIRGETNTFETILDVPAGTEVAIKRDLGISSEFSSGQVIWMERASKDDVLLSVVSNTPDVSVKIDGKSVGTTPYSTSDKNIISLGSSHKLEFSKDGYEGQVVDIQTVKGYKVNVQVDMFYLPLSGIPEEIETSIPKLKLYDLSDEKLASSISPRLWSAALTYYKSTRGKGLPDFSYFVDSLGTFYSSRGQELSAEDLGGKISDLKGDLVVIGYLGGAGGSLSKEALDSLNQAFSSGAGDIKGMGKVRVLETGQDFGLNVRSGPGVGYEKVGTIPVGSEYPLLEESGGWGKIRLDDGKEVWAILTYLKKVVSE